MEQMKRPIPVKILIASYGLLTIGITVAICFSAYVGWVAENGSLSDYQVGFVQGMGFNEYSYSLSEAGIYAGRMGPTLLTGLLCLFFLLRNMPNLFLAVFALDALLLTSGGAYILKVVVLILFFIPVSQAYFKTDKQSKPTDEMENV